MRLTNTYLQLGVTGITISAAPMLIALVMLSSWNLAMVVTGNPQINLLSVYQTELFIKTQQLFALTGVGMWLSLSLLEWINPTRRS